MKKLQGKGRTAVLWGAIASLLTAIVWMALPVGAVLTFASGPQEWFTRSYSYFDIGVLSFTPAGYGITVLLAVTCGLLFWAL